MAPRKLALMVSDAIDLDKPDVRAIRDRTAKWQQLFAPDTERYTLAGYEDLFSQAPDELLAYDNYAERETRWTGFPLYRSTWEREINGNFPKFVMYRIEMDRIEASGDLGWSAFTWFGEIEQGGETGWPAQHATHGWRKEQGVWRIVHEHLTSGVKEEGEPSMRPVDGSFADPTTLVHHRAA
ncbi:MAG: nuclear transport factor 2 family protein [Pseudomonadota bacterium]